MQRVLAVVSIVSLAAVILPAVAYLANWLEKDAMITVMLVGTIAWFVAAPLWMRRSPAESPGDQQQQGRI